ncbi:MAG: hypothetical protein AUJ79_11660 [Propionibacterium sp. CG1_02_60_36]|nr:MAG: hypothetical protein AUJ79_11660 [Propionibacterium sp. CG1_02_60_36]
MTQEKHRLWILGASDPDVLHTLAEDVNPRVRQAVADNTSTPGDTIRMLATDASSDVRRGATRNPLDPA